MVFESGILALLQRRRSWGVVRSDFEAYADTESREAMRWRLSDEEFESFKCRLADELLSEARHHSDIAKLAYQYWESRGCPYGSPNDDWFRAEKDLRLL